MIKDNRRQKMQLLTEWMDYFLLESKDEIQRSLNEEGIVLLENRKENENYSASFSLMVLTNQEVDLNLKLTFKTGEEKGKSFWFDIRKRHNGAVLLYNGDADFGNVVRYSLDAFLRYTSYKAFTHLLEWMSEAQGNRRNSGINSKEADDIIRESIVNYYLENQEFDALEKMMNQEESNNRVTK